MISLIHSGIEVRIYRVSSGNKLDCIASNYNSLIKNVLISFDADTKNNLLTILMYLKIANVFTNSKHIYL